MKIIKLVFLVSIGFYVLIVSFLFFAQESFLFQPSQLSSDHQYEFANPFEEINLLMEDGALLNALHFKHSESKGLILYYHGNAGNLSRWGEIVQYHAELGYDVLIMDYRKYGKSTGEWSYESFLEDAESFYQYASKTYAEEDIIVYGRSLGTGFASWVAANNNPKRLILESPYTSIADMGAFFYPLAPTKLLIRYNFRPSEYLKTVECPITIFHGTDDFVVPYDIGERLFHQLEINKEIRLVSIDGGGHNDLIDFPDFRKEVERLLK